MASNKLSVLDNKMPLKAYPKAKLNQVLKTEFRYWLSMLLSIKSDKDDELDAAIEVIKTTFWSLGLNEVKRAFEMYALSKLSIQPRSNHIDVILVGQIFNAYKATQRTQNKTQITKEDEDYHFIVCTFDTFNQDNKIDPETGAWLYDYFVHHKNWLEPHNTFKQNAWAKWYGFEDREQRAKSDLIQIFFEEIKEKLGHIKHFIATKNYEFKRKTSKS